MKPTQAQIDAALDAYAAKLTQIFDEFKELQPAHRRIAMIAALTAAAEVGKPHDPAQWQAWVRAEIEAATIERCAQICDYERDDLAAQIRALKDKP